MSDDTLKIDFEYGEWPVARHATIEHGITVEIRYEEDSSICNPREWSNIGTMFCYHRDYRLGDEQLPSDGFAEIDCPVCEGGDLDIIGPVHLRNTMAGYPVEDAPECSRCENLYRVEPTVQEWLKDNEAIAAMPLFLLDHSGITMTSGRLVMALDDIARTDTQSSNRFVGDEQGWDTSFVGFIIATEDGINECCGDGEKYRTHEFLEEALNGEVKTYATYLEGECFYIRIEDADGDDLADGPIGGFLGTENAEENATEMAERAIQEVEQERTAVADWAARDVCTT